MAQIEAELFVINLALARCCLFTSGMSVAIGFQKAQLGSNEREFCGDGLEFQKDRRSRWALLVCLKLITGLASLFFSSLC